MFAQLLERRRGSSLFSSGLFEREDLADFLEAWYPDGAFAFGGRGPITARSVDDEREILTVGFVDLPSREKLSDATARLADQERVRHHRLDELIESTVVRRSTSNSTSSRSPPASQLRPGARSQGRQRERSAHRGGWRTASAQPAGPAWSGWDLQTATA
jgi:hypothetical protein